MTNNLNETDGPTFVDAATVRRLTPMPELIAALDEAFRSDIALPPRQVYGLPGGNTLLVMPAWQIGRDTGVKVVTIHPSARPAVKGTYLLIDGQNGGVRAILDGTMLTLRRTGAVSALVSDKLARRDADTLLMIGTGALAPHLIEAHASVRPLKKVMIWGRDPAKAQLLADGLRHSGLPVSAVSDLDQAVGCADIISAATLSTSPLIKGMLVKPGTHLDLVGAYRPDMAEADAVSFRKAFVCVDSRGGALTEAGDIIQAIDAGMITADDIAVDLNELCLANDPLRTDEAMITVFKSVGLSIEDLVAAQLVYAEHQRSTAGRHA